MFRREPKERIETSEIPVVGWRSYPDGSGPEKDWQTGRSLTIFKSLVLTALIAIILYGMLNRGLLGPERWLPVVTAILGIFFITLFITDYFGCAKDRLGAG